MNDAYIAMAAALGIAATYVEACARQMATVVITEHGGVGDGADYVELVGIAYVLRNRQFAQRAPFPDDVITTSWTGGGAEVLERYQVKRQAAKQRPSYEATVAMCRTVFVGLAENPVGPRQHFLHPGPIVAEGRDLPSWSTTSQTYGSSSYEPVRIGAAIFS